MKKSILLLLILIGIAQTLNAQKIKFKKGVITADGKVIMKYDNLSPLTKELTSLDDNHTIYLKFIHNSEYTNGETYTKIVFVEENKNFTSKSYIFTKKLLIKKMLQNKVLNLDGTFNTHEIDKMIMRYDEKIEDQKKEVHIIIR